MEWLTYLGSALPVTVVAAIILFVVKEIWELTKRVRSDGRKRKAIHRLIGIELEVNKWVLKKVLDAAFTIERALAEKSGTLSIIKTNSGMHRLEYHYEDDRRASSMPIPVTRKESVSRYLMEIALIDPDTFPLVLEASTALNELDHLRETIINEVEDHETLSAFGEGLVSYLRDEVADIDEVLAKLYFEVTGQKYQEFRVR
jgi:hypothetical protein